LGFVCSLAMSRDHERTLVAIEAGVSEVTCKFVSGILPACCLVEGVEWCAGLLILCESTIRLTHQGLLFTRISGRPCSKMVFLFFLHVVARRGTRRARHAYMQRRTLWGTRTRAGVRSTCCQRKGCTMSCPPGLKNHVFVRMSSLLLLDFVGTQVAHAVTHAAVRGVRVEVSECSKSWCRLAGADRVVLRIPHGGGAAQLWVSFDGLRPMDPPDIAFRRGAGGDGTFGGALALPALRGLVEWDHTNGASNGA
jgi:hypothetical protein